MDMAPGSAESPLTAAPANQDPHDSGHNLSSVNPLGNPFWLAPPKHNFPLGVDLASRVSDRVIRRVVAALLGLVPRGRRARLTAALTKEAKRHEEWSRCLTSGEAEEWARKLTRIATERHGLEAGEAAKIAGAIARRARKYSHDPQAQARRARDREAKRRERQRPRDERWMRDHDERQMTWKQIGDRDGKSQWTVRSAVHRLRRRLGLKLTRTYTSTDPGLDRRPSTVRCTPYPAPPDTLPSSPRSGPAVATYGHLNRLRLSIERGARPIDAVLAVADSLQRRLQSISEEFAALRDERDAIYSVVACVDPTERDWQAA